LKSIEGQLLDSWWWLITGSTGAEKITPQKKVDFAQAHQKGVSDSILASISPSIRS